MSLRFNPFLLAVILLVVLNACSTTGPGPAIVHPIESDVPAQAETDEQLSNRELWAPSDRSLAETAELTSNMSVYQPDIALEILRSLESVPSSQLSAMIDSQTQDPEFTEWLELALQARSLMTSGGSITAAAQHWSDYHYGHVITQARYPELIQSYSALFPAPSQVAILLPTEGGLAAASKAIRDGIVSAYLEQPGNSSIRFYSSGETGESAIAAYLQAREDGATQIVGPLRLESTRALAALDDLSVPILLLNEPGSDKTAKPDQTAIVNSLALSQTEEAAAIANSALAHGQKHALLIVPNDSWGTRVETAFATIFEQGEGRISASSYVNTATSDHSAMLTQLLKIDESTQRKTDLQSRIGIPLTFEPTSRDDFDFIFLAAKPKQGRELKPLLRFHDAGDIPVYAMGRIYSGKTIQSSDQDLNGVIFPTTSWQLETAGVTGNTPDSVRGGAFGNLYALGRDAWYVLPWLPLMQKDPDLWFSGNVGELRLQADGRLYRQPAWAQFSAGLPVPYQWPDKP
jgi:outer membrane PBP1 activator LpoA protein